MNNRVKSTELMDYLDETFKTKYINPEMEEYGLVDRTIEYKGKEFALRTPDDETRELSIFEVQGGIETHVSTFILTKEGYRNTIPAIVDLGSQNVCQCAVCKMYGKRRFFKNYLLGEDYVRPVCDNKICTKTAEELEKMFLEKHKGPSR